MRVIIHLTFHQGNRWDKEDLIWIVSNKYSPLQKARNDLNIVSDMHLKVFLFKKRHKIGKMMPFTGLTSASMKLTHKYKLA